MLLSVSRILLWTIALGGTAFAVGFFGPLVLAPGANQGPLLGIFVTGPLGLLAGLILGISREILGYTAGPRQVLARLRLPQARPASTPGLFRAISGAAGVLLALYALAEAKRGGVTRGVAASFVICMGLLFYAATGRAPTWFLR